jgi:serine/threonine protein kinase
MSIENKQNNAISQELPDKIFSDSDELRILDNNYILGACLLRTVTGDIYAAWDAAIGIESLSNSSSYDFPSQFFIKLLPDNFFQLNEISQIIAAEIEQLKDCFDWCKVVAFKKNAEAAYLVLQLPRGDFFSKKLVAKRPYGNLSEVLVLITNINKTLNILKECGIRHGRVEPDSIYITEDGDIGLVDSIYVAAKQHQLEQDIDHNATVPNKEALYASPDVCFGREVSDQDDVFSLACICYRLLSGQHPFSGANSVSALLNKIRPKPITTLSEDQWQNLEYGLSLAKESRPQTVKEFINGFDLTSKPLKLRERRKKEKEAAAARKDAQNLIRNQVKRKVAIKKQTQNTKLKTKQKAKSKIKPKTKKPILHNSPFADLHETDLTTWFWIPLSLLSGMLVGIIAILLSINFFGLSLPSLVEMVKNFF